MARKKKQNTYREAFFLQYNLIMLGFFTVLSLILWNPLPLVLAFGLEIIYMALVPGSQVFQRFLNLRARQDKNEARETAHAERIEALSFEQQRTVQKANRLIEAIEKNFELHGDLSGGATTDKLLTLRERLLWLMELSNVYDSYLTGINGPKLEQERHAIKNEHDRAKGRLRQSLADRISVLDKRAARLTKVRENRAVIKNQVATVIDILHLMQESSMTMHNPAGISQQLDDLLTEVETTEAAISELESMTDQHSDDAFDQELEKALEKAHVVQHS